MRENRDNSFGQNYKLTFVDNFGIWLSSKQIRRNVKNFNDKIVADIGCGFNASYSKTIVDQIKQLYLVDVSISDSLKSNSKVEVLEGFLPEVLMKIPDNTVDILICNSVIEHLWEPELTLKEFYRIISPNNGVCLINVPSWKGKKYLEYFAFKLNLSPKEEMDDHKNYFNVNDLWRILRTSGFLPSNIKCFTHKFGLNIFAVCMKMQKMK
jgi:ubiquinone/menaquinone biosynthesis C-methylase UbiE